MMKILNLNNKGVSLTSILVILIILLLGFIVVKSLQKPKEIQPSTQRFEAKPISGLPRPVIKQKKKPKQRRRVELPPDFIW